MAESSPDPQSALATVSAWLAGANAVALLRATMEAKVLPQLAEPKTAGELADAVGIDSQRATFVCQALEAHGIAEREGDRYRTHPDFLALEADDRPLLLRELVFANAMLQRGIDECLRASPGFGGVDEGESLALARLAWGRPQSEQSHQMWREVDSQMPEVTAIWERGGSYAEFGCGAGRDLLRVAVMYPKVAVTGHDLLAHLLEDCRRQARELGLEDRVELVQGDVVEAGLEDAYDTLMWSQMFFPKPTRPAALEAVRRALVRGGYLLMPVMPDVPAPEETDDSPQTRGLLLARLAYPRWQIEWDPEGTVKAEVEAAGFEYVRSIPNPRTPYLLFRAPN